MNMEYQTGTGRGAGPDGWVHTDSSRPPLTCGRISRYLKGEGRNALLGHIGTTVSANAGYILLVLIMNFLAGYVVPGGTGGLILMEALSFLISVVSGILEYGLVSIYMNLQYGQTAKFSDLFNGFRENSNKIIIVEAVLVLIGTACGLPYVIASYVAGGLVTFLLLAAGLAVYLYFHLTFFFALFVLLDYPDLRWQDVLKKSSALVKGHKKHLLYMECSFLPLDLLSILSFGTAQVVIFGYKEATFAAFYKGRMEGKLMA